MNAVHAQLGSATSLQTVVILLSGSPPCSAFPCSSLLGAFEREALLDSSYFFCKQDSVVQAAQLLGEVRRRGAPSCLRC